VIGAQTRDVSYYLADLIVNAKDERALDVVARQTAECIRGVEDPRFVALSAARKEIFIGAQDTRLSIEVLRMTIRRLAELPGQRMLVLASPGFFARTPDERSALENVLDLAARNNVVISTLDVRGVYSTRHSDASNELGASPPRSRLNQGPPPVASDASSGVQPNDVEGQYYLQSALASGDVLDDLAAGTSGTYFHGNNDLTAGLNRLASAPEVRYVIGFSPSELRPDESFHSLGVRVLNQRRVSVQARRGYFAANPATEAWAQIHDAVFSRDEMNDIPIDVAAQVSKAGAADARLIVMAKVHAECLHYQKSDGRSHDSLTIVWALFNDEGNYVDGTTKIIKLVLSDRSLANFADAGIDVQSSYTMKPRIYLVRVVIRETDGDVMSAHNLTVTVR
jgi:VWFA-related protein